MEVRNHRLYREDGTAVEFVKSPNTGGRLRPQYLVMHYTAGRSARSSISWLTNRRSRASAHLVIARDGAVTQLVPFNKVAWHAGLSRWEGLVGLNAHSIGIELDNAGPLVRQAGIWRAWFGTEYPEAEVVEAVHKNESEARGWHAYREKQIASAVAVAQAIVGKYGLKDVVGHDDIAPDRMSDPGPAFPMQSFRGAVMGRAEEILLFETVTHLNIRNGPGTAFDKLDASPLPPATRLMLNRTEGDWRNVDVLDGGGASVLSGWVHGAYIRVGAWRLHSSRRADAKEGRRASMLPGKRAKGQPGT
jgi:N-acetylmuramoyl-L-alanine amidase